MMLQAKRIKTSDATYNKNYYYYHHHTSSNKIVSLPVDCWSMILQYSSVIDLAVASTLCHTIHNATSHQTDCIIASIKKSNKTNWNLRSLYMLRTCNTNIVCKTSFVDQKLCSSNVAISSELHQKDVLTFIDTKYGAAFGRTAISASSGRITMFSVDNTTASSYIGIAMNMQCENSSPSNTLCGMKYFKNNRWLLHEDRLVVDVVPGVVIQCKDGVVTNGNYSGPDAPSVAVLQNSEDEVVVLSQVIVVVNMLEGFVEFIYKYLDDTWNRSGKIHINKSKEWYPLINSRRSPRRIHFDDNEMIVSYLNQSRIQWVVESFY